MIRHILFAALVLVLGNDGYAQSLPHADSVKVQAYWDSANHCRLYSYRRQLYLDSALTIMPGNAFFWQQKAMPLYKQKKYEAGAPFLDSAVKYNPKSYLEYRAFMKCIFQKSYRESINDFRSATKLNGNSVVMDHSYEFYTGLSYLQLNMFDSAEYFIGNSVNKRKERLGEDWLNPTELFYLGIIQYEKEQYAPAITTFDRCLKLYPNFTDAEYYKASCLVAMKKYAEALPVMADAKKNFDMGNTFSEDNIYYEAYPYQVPKYMIEGAAEHLKELASK